MPLAQRLLDQTELMCALDLCLWPVHQTRALDLCLWPVHQTRALDLCIGPVR